MRGLDPRIHLLIFDFKGNEQVFLSLDGKGAEG
jgi:hypothetical protein